MDFYIDKNGKLQVDTTDNKDEYSSGLDEANVKTLSVKFKKPSHADYMIIRNGVTDSSDLHSMQILRMSILIREWNSKKDISNIASLDSKITKAVIEKIRYKIEYDGIL